MKKLSMEKQSQIRTVYTETTLARLSQVFWLPVAAIFTLGGNNLIREQNSLLGYLSILVGLAILAAAIKRFLHPKTIIANADGVEIRTSFRKSLIPWNTIEKFDVYTAPMNWLSVFNPEGFYLSPALIVHSNKTFISVYRGRKASSIAATLNDLKTEFSK